MPKKSLSTVKIFYPRYSQVELPVLLRKRILGLAAVLPLKRVVLFGSWAKGKATAFSDIDLLVVYQDPPQEDAYNLVWKHMDLHGLQSHVYSQQEAEQHKTMLERMTKDGISLFP